MVDNYNLLIVNKCDYFHSLNYKILLMSKNQTYERNGMINHINYLLNLLKILENLILGASISKIHKD